MFGIPNPWEIGAATLAGLLILGTAFGAGYATASRSDLKIAAAAPAKVAKAQEKQDVKTHQQAVAVSDKTTANDKASSAKAKIIVKIIHDTPPEKTCEVPLDVISMLNEAGHY